MQIAQRKIGPTEPPLVIAEFGINHGGDLDVARHMVTLAAKAGASGSGEITGYEFEKGIGKTLTRVVTKNTRLKWSDLK